MDAATIFVGVVMAAMLGRSLWTIVEAVRLRRAVVEAAGRPAGNWTPPTTVFAPCKGLDPDLEAGLAALLSQDHPDYELLLLIEGPDDPAHALAARVLAGSPRAAGLRRAEIVHTGQATTSGQKVHNLLVGLTRAATGSEVFAFFDSDVHPGADWLRRLLAPLEDGTVAVATGFRWYVPIRGGVGAALLSSWNAFVCGLMAQPSRSFAWGGSMAMTRRTFEELRIGQQWAGAISDDGVVDSSCRRAGRVIRFVPGVLVLSRHDMTLPVLYEFVWRQFRMARLCYPLQFRLALVLTVLYMGTLVGGPVLAAARAEWDWPAWVLTGGAAAMAVVGGVAAELRRRVGLARFPQHADAIAGTRWAFVTGGVTVPILNLICLLRASFGRRLVWRGITYELHGPDRLTILGRK